MKITNRGTEKEFKIASFVRRLRLRHKLRVNLPVKFATDRNTRKRVTSRGSLLIEICLIYGLFGDSVYVLFSVLLLFLVKCWLTLC